MACSLPHTVEEIKAMLQKQIDEAKVRQLAIINLAVEYENACLAKDDLRKAYKECNDIPQEKRNLIVNFLNEESDKDYEMHNAFVPYLTEDQERQLLLDEDALKETLEEEARHEKEWQERMRQEQTHDELFRLEFGVISDSKSD
ncbi:hypothetical protein Tco_0867539 [Tanacetum coccineum]